MKNLKTAVFTTAFALLSVAASAVDIPEFTIKNEGQKSFVLHFDKVLTEKVQIRIFDENHSLLLAETIKEKGPFLKKYDLVNLPVGRFFVKIEDAFTVLIQPVDVLETTLAIDPQLMKTIFKPVIRANGSLVDLTFLQTEEAVTSISILDETGFPVFEEKIETYGSITRRYDVSQLAHGDYEFKVSVNNDVYYRSFRVGGPSF